MNKGFILATMLLLCVSFGLAASSTTPSAVVIDLDSVRIGMTVNETVRATAYICSAASCNAPEITYAFTTNATSFSYTYNSLTPNTLYYYKFNGTTTGTDLAFNSAINSFTTEDYKINGVGRTILGLFVFILVGFAVVYMIMPLWKSGKIREMVILMATILLSAAILFQWLAAILGL